MVTLADVPKFSDDDLWKWWWWHFWWYWFSSWWKVTDARVSADTFIFFSWHLFDKSNFVAWVISVLKWKRLPYKNVFFSNKYFFNSETNMTPFLCRRNFLKKTNCFKSLGEKRLQKVDLIEYIFLPQNFLRRVCLQKPQGRECDREARGKNMLPMVENSHYSIGTSRSSTLLLQYIHWFFVELLQLEA